MRNCCLLLMAILLPAEVRVERRPDAVSVFVDGKQVTSFEYGPVWDKPFLFPLQSPSGVTLTRGWPVAERPGDSKDHRFHRGLFFGHRDINGMDFWLEGDAGKTGRIAVTSSPVWRKGMLQVVGSLIPPGGPRLGSMLAKYRFARAPQAYEIEVWLTIAADAGVDLKLGDTEEALLGLRLAEEFREDRGATLMNSNGLVGTKNIWGKQAAWVDYSTSREGKKVGVAFLDHPTNPRSPTYWHARGYALNAANAFGVRHFTGDKTKDGALTVAKGKRITFRYLLLLHDGDASEAKVAQRFDAWKTK